METLFHDTKKIILLLFLVSIVLCSPLLVPGIFFGHDSDSHFSRIAATAIALGEHQFPPLIAANLCNSFGYGWNIFYSPLSAYIPVLLAVIIGSYAVAYKLFIFLTLFLSGVFMYFFVKDTINSTGVAILAALFYVTAPYRIVDIFLRAALGEIMAFVFIPLVFHGLYSIVADNGKKHYLLALGMTGLILSHVVSSFIITLFVLLYLLLYIGKLKDFKVWKLLLINALFTIAMTAFFLVPLLEHRINVDYHVFQAGAMFSPALAKDQGTFLYQILLGNFQNGVSISSSSAEFVQKEMPYNIGLQLLLPLMATPFIWQFIKKQKILKSYINWYVIGSIALFLTTIYFPWNKMPYFFAVVQFPWRYLIIVIFAFSLIAAYNTHCLVQDLKLKHVLLILAMILIHLQPLINATSNYHMNFTMKEYWQIEKIDATVKGSWGLAMLEYLPQKAFENYDYVGSRPPGVLVKAGDASIDSELKTGTKLYFRVTNASQTSALELPYIYYLGYRAIYHTNDGNTINLHPYQSDKGFVAITIPAGSAGEVKVSYTGTMLTKLSLAVSIIALLLFCIQIKKSRNIVPNK